MASVSKRIMLVAQKDAKEASPTVTQIYRVGTIFIHSSNAEDARWNGQGAGGRRAASEYRFVTPTRQGASKAACWRK